MAETSSKLEAETGPAAAKQWESESTALANVFRRSPDGGLEAWLVVLGSMVVLIHTWGLANSFGIFQT
jgi:hypothetical protein